MATLQKIRSKGPLLIIVIGLALFAFIAGDAWKVMQPHQSQDVGEINGESLTAQDYQTMVEEYTEVVKFSRGKTSLTDDESNQIKDEVWQQYVNNSLIEHEAEKIGLVVSDAEIQAIINEGTHYMLRNTPFTNPNTGVFDRDALKKFLLDYSNMNRAQMPSSYLEQYDKLYNYWRFLEKNLYQVRLQQKYTSLISQSLLSNPIEARNAFNGRTTQSEIRMAAVPYTAVHDSLVTVPESEIKALYDQRKDEQYRQIAETRGIRYINVQVTASEEDRAALQTEMEEYVLALGGEPADYTTFIRSTGSDAPYVDLFYTTRTLPTDVVARLDSAAIGQVYGPYYNVADNSINAFKKLAKASLPDSVQLYQIQVVESTLDRTRTLADSIYTAVKGGADIAAIAKSYGQSEEPVWIASANYEGANVDGDNLTYLNTVMSAGKNELINLNLSQGNIVVKVVDRRAMTDKYKVAIVKRPIEFSKETYSQAYNDFSQFIATNNNLEKMVANAEDSGYRLLVKEDLSSTEHTIGGIKGTKDALRWAFDAEVGEVSGLYECGDNDQLLVVGLANIIPAGYRPFQLVRGALRNELLTEKKAEKILSDLKAAGATTIDQVAALPDAVSDTIKHITFAASTYVRALRHSEPLVSVHTSVAELGQQTGPIEGSGGVILVEPINRSQMEEEYDQAKEENTLRSSYARASSQYLNDLYLAAKVKDSRYLYF